MTGPNVERRVADLEETLNRIGDALADTIKLLHRVTDHVYAGTPLCEESGCDLPAVHMWKQSFSYALYCKTHFGPHEAARLARYQR